MPENPQQPQQGFSFNNSGIVEKPFQPITVQPAQPDLFTKYKTPLIIVGFVLFLSLVGTGTYLGLKHQNSLEPANVPAIVKQDQTIHPTPSPTPITSPTPAPSLTAGPTPTAIPTSGNFTGWKTYSFAALGLTVKYPPDWNVVVSASSDGKSFHLYNSVSQDIGKVYNASTDKAKYSVYVGSFAVGVSSLADLQTILAKDNGLSTDYYGTPAGTMTVTNTQTETIGTQEVISRIVTYSKLPTVTTPQVFFLDGHGNAIKTELELDTTNGVPFYNQILSSMVFGQ